MKNLDIQHYVKQSNVRQNPDIGDEEKEEHSSSDQSDDDDDDIGFKKVAPVKSVTKAKALSATKTGGVRKFKINLDT